MPNGQDRAGWARVMPPAVLKKMPSLDNPSQRPYHRIRAAWNPIAAPGRNDDSKLKWLTGCERMRIGLPEIFLIILVIIIFVNPKEFPGLFRKVGKLFQQIKSMRETFTRGMKDFETVISRPFEPAGESSKDREGSGNQQAAAMVIRTSTESLPVQARIWRESSPTAPTSLHLCVSTGMGDRIVFQGIIRHAIEAGGADARIISVTYDVGNKYFVKDYRPLPSELWTIPRPAHPDALETHIAQRVREVAVSRYSRSGAIIIHDYRDGALMRDADVSIRNEELYAHYTSALAPLRIFPDFLIDQDRFQIVREKLTQRFPDWESRPAAALHIRQGNSMSEKNPALSDMQALARLLRSHGFRLVLIAGNDESIPDMEKVCDFKSPVDPSLQDPASILRLCDVFIGGDSGPAHLAAAVGTPVVSLRPPRSPWVNGPFCDSGRLATLQGTIVIRDGKTELAFDSDAAAARAVEFLGSSKAWHASRTP